jgi:hypothetical protein
MQNDFTGSRILMVVKEISRQYSSNLEMASDEII